MHFSNAKSLHEITGKRLPSRLFFKSLCTIIGQNYSHDACHDEWYIHVPLLEKSVDTDQLLSLEPA